MNKKFFLYKRTNRIFCGLSFVLFLVLCCPAYGNSGTAGQGGGSTDFSSLTVPVSASPARSPTVPVSSYSAGTFLTAPSLSASGNMIMTGNVGGGRYFRGYLPYTSPGTFMGKLESTSLDSFLRYSAPAGPPFYSPTASAPGSELYQNAVSDKIRTGSVSSQIAYPSVGLMDSSAAAPVSRYNLSASYNQYQAGLLGSVSGYKVPEQFFNMQPAAQLPIQAETGQPKSTSISESLVDVIRPIDTTSRNKKIQQEKTPDMSERFKAQVDQFDQKLQEQIIKEAADQKIKDTIAEQWKEKLKGKQGNTSALPGQFKAETTPNPAELKPRPSSATKPFPRTAEAEKQFEERFNQYMLSAELLLKQGDFYRAADDFTWASLYKPAEPAGYVGKGIALFAAGEYMTASQLVAAGLRLSADYAKTKLDLAQMLGKEKLEARISDLDKCSKVGSAGELYFLLAFVQYKTGQSQQAKASIDEAEKKMPDENVVKALKNIIYQPDKK